MFEKIPLREVLMFLRSLPATVFQVEKGEDGKFGWLFYEGELAVEMGLDTEHLRGRKVEETMPPNLPKDLVQRLEESSRRGDLQKEIYPWDGRWLKLYLQPSQGPTEKTIAVDGAVTDVTQRIRAVLEQKQMYEDLKRRTQQLTRAHERAEQLNYTLSHDLRNPLTVILALCEVAKREIEQGSGDPAKRVEKIRQSADRLNQLLSDILKLSRAGRYYPDRKEVDVTKIASQALKQLSSAQPEREMTVKVEPGIKVFGEPNLVQDLMENLLSNAWKYTSTKKRPRIEVRKEMRGGDLWVVVEDNGIGFQPEDKERLFRPFTRLESATSFTGTGVGLATVKRIAERHGGMVDAEGQPGQGAKFSFTLPLPEDASEAQPEGAQGELDVGEAPLFP